MASIMTNISAMTALQSLNLTNKNLSKTQSHISTGYRVASAEDNAALGLGAATSNSTKSVATSFSRSGGNIPAAVTANPP